MADYTKVTAEYLGESVTFTLIGNGVWRNGRRMWVNENPDTVWEFEIRGYTNVHIEEQGELLLGDNVSDPFKKGETP